MLYTFVLRIEICTTFEPKVVQISANNTKVYKICEICLAIYIFLILQHLAICNFTNFKLLFLAIVMDFVSSYLDQNLVYSFSPLCSVISHAGDPHCEPSAHLCLMFRSGNGSEIMCPSQFSSQTTFSTIPNFNFTKSNYRESFLSTVYKREDKDNVQCLNNCQREHLI